MDSAQPLHGFRNDAGKADTLRTELGARQAAVAQQVANEGVHAACRSDEALVFKVYDSAKDGRARWTAHTAFDDPTSTPASRPRESIEIRTLAFF